MSSNLQVQPKISRTGLDDYMKPRCINLSFF